MVTASGRTPRANSTRLRRARKIKPIRAASCRRASASRAPTNSTRRSAIAPAARAVSTPSRRSSMPSSGRASTASSRPCARMCCSPLATPGQPVCVRAVPMATTMSPSLRSTTSSAMPLPRSRRSRTTPPCSPWTLTRSRSVNSDSSTIRIVSGVGTARSGRTRRVCRMRTATATPIPSSSKRSSSPGSTVRCVRVRAVWSSISLLSRTRPTRWS